MSERKNCLSRPTDAEIYGYGTLAVIIISICPLVSVGIAGFKKSSSYKYIISTMLGLCVGSLVADAVLHLIPTVLGLHSHGSSSPCNHTTNNTLPSMANPKHHHEHDHHHDHNHHHDHDHHHEDDDHHGHGNQSAYFNNTSNDTRNSVQAINQSMHQVHNHGHDDHHGHGHHHEHDMNHTWKMLCVCGSLWGFLILQLVIHGTGKMIERRKQRKKLQSAYYNNTSNDPRNTVQMVNAISNGDTQSDIFKTTQIDSFDDSLEVHAHSSVAWMVTIGDALHNFTDGLAIGAAFTQSNFSGLATSIAIFCHELPHEFGDAALMLSAGWSYKLVLLLQFLAQVTAFIGLYNGIALSNAFDEAQTWIFAVAAGMFLYVALCDAVPEILELANTYGTLVIGLLSNLGIGVAMAIMILLAVYEDNLRKSIEK